MTEAIPRAGAERDESSARNEKDLFRAIAEATEDLVTMVDAEGRFVFVNTASQRFLGPTPEELVGRSALDFVHPDDQESTREALRRWTAGDPHQSRSIENRQMHRDGSVRHVLWTVTRHTGADGQLRLVSYAKDITPIRRAEHLLEERELRLRALLAGMLDAVVAIDSMGIVRFTSDSVRDIFGWDPPDLVGRNVNVLLPEPHRSLHDDYLARYRETGETWILNTTREFEAQHKNGHKFWIELSVSRIEVPNQEPLFCGAFRDITDRKNAHRIVRESEQRFRAIFDQEFQMVGLLEPSGRVLEINRAAIQLVGSTREDVVGRVFWETPWWAASPELPELCRKWVRRAARGEFVRDEIEVRSASGETHVMDFSLKPVRGEEGRVELLIPEARDITELKRAQDRETSMLRALAALGESASLLAHEIKNPITSIHLALRAVASKLGEDEASAIEDLLDRLRRLEATLRRTLSFAKPLDLDAHDTDVLPLLLGPVDQLRPEAESRNIELALEVDRDCPSVCVDEGLVGDLIGNLVRNAIDVVADGGHVSITAHRRPQGGVRIRVEDDGPGIPDSVQETLFQPFVTTKDRGTGLGLPLARKVAEEHGGRLVAFSSDRLGGACFEFELPTAPA